MDANKPSPAPVPALDQLATPLAWADRQGRITGVNPAFPRWIGVGVRRLVGQPLAALDSGVYRFIHRRPPIARSVSASIWETTLKTCRRAPL